MENLVKTDLNLLIGLGVTMLCVEQDLVPAICMAYVRDLLGRNLSTNSSSSLNWPLLLDALPLLAPTHMESLVKRRNIKMAVLSLVRFLSISLPANILEMLLIPRKWYGTHIQSSNSTPDHTQISSSEISSSLQKLAFLTLHLKQLEGFCLQTHATVLRV